MTTLSSVSYLALHLASGWLAEQRIWSARFDEFQRQKVTFLKEKDHE